MAEDRLEKLERREAQLKEQIKQEKAKRKAKERKARTKRLIETGAVVEKAIGMEFKTKEDRELLSKILITPHKHKHGNGEWSYANLIAKAIKTQQENDNDRLATQSTPTTDDQAVVLQQSTNIRSDNGILNSANEEQPQETQVTPHQNQIDFSQIPAQSNLKNNPQE